MMQSINYGKMSVEELCKMAREILDKLDSHEKNQEEYTKARNCEYNRLISKKLLKPTNIQTISGEVDLWKLFGYLGTFPEESIVFASCGLDNSVCDIFTCTLESTTNSASTDVVYAIERLKKHNAVYVYMAHNHPSGILKESVEDVCLTNVIKTMCGLSGMQLKDHLIVTLRNLYSIKQQKIVY